MADQTVNVMNKARYLGHVISNDLCDDEDVQRQCCKLYAQAKTLAHTYHTCPPLYTAHFWCSDSQQT